MVLKLYGKCVIKHIHGKYYDIGFSCLIGRSVCKNQKRVCITNTTVLEQYFRTIVESARDAVDMCWRRTIPRTQSSSPAASTSPIIGCNFNECTVHGA